MDLFDYISHYESATTSYVRDKAYNKIISDLDEFIKSLSDQDKQLLIQITSKCYFKYQDSIKAKGTSGFELNLGLLMAILLDQQLQIDTLIK